MKKYNAYNNREAIKNIDGKLEINEDELDIFSYYEEEIPDWKPSRTMPPFADVSKIRADIETTGFLEAMRENPDQHRIILIGLRNERGINKIIYDKSEKKMLMEFVRILNEKKPDILSFFNGFEFDLPYIHERLLYHNLPSPFWIRPEKTTFKTAQKWGEPVSYNAFYLNFTNADGTRKQCAIIDLYHQLLSWDYVARKLTRHNLKESVIELGFRGEERLVLSYEEMMQSYRSGDLTELIKYLEYDLEDTELLGDFLEPAIYYQQELLDWKLQSLSTSGNGSKWNDILKKHYPYNTPESDSIKRFKGALTYAKGGLFYNCFKVDVASLYPSIMLGYGICSKKDKKKIALSILKYLKGFRLELKEKKELGTATNEEKRREGTAKVFINSLYGQLGCGFIEYNDYEAAALVTAYGRAIFKLMVEIAEQNGGIPVSCFTGDTSVITSEGDKQIKDILNRKIQVLNGKKQWVDVEFKSYGLSNDIYELTFKNCSVTKTVRCTGNHKWFTKTKEEYSRDGKWFRKETRDLEYGSHFPYIKYNDSGFMPDWTLVKKVKISNHVEEVFCCEEPITHSFTLSDNILSSNCDTDGTIITYDPNVTSAEKIHQAMNEAMPRGIDLGLEWKAKALYVPPRKKSDEGQGLKKTYIIMYEDKKDKEGNIKKGGIKANGKFKKRDRYFLERDFQPAFIKILVEQGRIEADKYYLEIMNQLRNETYPIDSLKVTRKIKANEKTLVRQGIGQPGEQVIFYRGIGEPRYGKRGQRLKHDEIKWTTDGPCNYLHYASLLEQMYMEIVNTIKA